MKGNRQEMKRLIIIAGIILSSTGFASAADLKEYKATYEENMGEIILSHGMRTAGLRKQYARSLDSLFSKVKHAGDLDKTTAVMAERERFRKENSMPGKLSELLEVGNLQAAYADRVSTYEFDKAKKVMRLVLKYDQALGKLQRTLVMSNQVDAARAVQEERTLVKKREDYVEASRLIKARSNLTAAKAEAEAARAAAMKEEQARQVRLTLARKYQEGAGQFGSHYYKVFHKDTSWHKAKEQCEKMGGHLAIIETAEELRWIGGIARGKVLWLGASDKEQEGSFRWINNEPVSLRVILNAGDRDYMALASDGVMNCRRADGYAPFRTRHIHGYICEWDE